MTTKLTTTQQIISELMDDPQGEAKLHERRILFFAAMRQPEMRILRLALRHLDWDKGLDWQSIKSIQCEYYADGCCWMLTTDKYLVVCLDAQSLTLTYEDFCLIHRHQENNPVCPCEMCEMGVSHE